MGEEKTKVSRNIKLWPVLYTIGCDFLFFWVINVAFLTEVKGLSYEQFFMLDLIAAAVDLITAVPFLYLIAKLGNNTSLRVAQAFMVTGAILFTFGNSMVYFIIANCLYFKAYQFFIVYPLILENNLEKYGRKQDFIKYNARGKLGYATLTLLIAFVAGSLFDLNPYIPMLACIGFTVVSFILSFFVVDETHGKYDAKGIFAKPKEGMDKSLILFTVLFMLFIVFFKGCWYIGNQYTKISLQEIGVIIEVLTIVIFAARGVRVLINFFTEKIIQKFHKGLSYALPMLLLLGLLLLALPLILVQDFWAQLILISLGVILIYSIYDIYKLYVYDIIVNRYPKDMHLKLFWMSCLLETLGIMVANIVITCAVANLPVGIALLILSGVSLVGVVCGLWMHVGFFRKNRVATQDLIDDML